MPRHQVRSRSPQGRTTAVAFDTDPDRLAAHRCDAAHVPGGHAVALTTPEDEAQVADVLRRASSVLVIGAQSSLTGGATPHGEVLLSTARLSQLDVAAGHAVAGAGVTLATLESRLAGSGAWYPPAPTYSGATVGGVIATNAAGAATFKYGSTRAWVEALTIVLADGDVLDLERGQVTADERGGVDLTLARGQVRIDMPGYTMPAVPKVSAGYFSAPGMDLIDLFIGAEGTLGIVTSATLRTQRLRTPTALALVQCSTLDVGLALADELRTQSQATWRGEDPNGLDVSAIEHLDRRSLDLLRADEVDRKLDVTLLGDTELALLVTLELPPGLDARQAYEIIGSAREPDAADSALVRFCRCLDAANLLDRTEFAGPGDRARHAQLLAFREAVPVAVNQRVGVAQQSIDARVQKIAADVIVPVERLRELLDACAREFRSRQLDGAVWGHLSDGNLHPNVIPSRLEDLESGLAAMLAIGRTAIRLGGSPCAEHGVGRNRVKQQLVRELYGDRGLAAMQRIKRALDPHGKLAPGVLGL